MQRQAALMVERVLEECKAGSRGGIKRTEAEWSNIKSHLGYILSMSNWTASLTEFQAFIFIDSVTTICLANPVREDDICFRGLEAVQLITFINSCRE